MEPEAPNRGMRVLCPIHSPDPAPPTSEPVGSSEAAEAPTPDPQLRRGCQGNQVFDTAIAKDLAGCAFAAYHQLSGDPAVSRGSIPRGTCAFMLNRLEHISHSDISHAVRNRVKMHAPYLTLTYLTPSLRKHARAKGKGACPQCFDTDMAGTSTAYLDRDFFLRTVGNGLEVEVLGAHNIPDKAGVSTALHCGKPVPPSLTPWSTQLSLHTVGFTEPLVSKHHTPC